MAKRRAGNNKGGGEPAQDYSWVLAPAFPYTTHHVSCSAVVLVGPQGGHRLSMQMEAQFKLCLSFAIPGDNQTKRIYLSLAKSNPSQVKRGPGTKSFVLACHEIERALFDLPQEPDNDTVN